MKRSIRRGLGERCATRGLRVNYAEDSEDSFADSHEHTPDNRGPKANPNNDDTSETLGPVTEVDDYCFKCHKSIQKTEDRQICCSSKCNRSYHRTCARGTNNTLGPEWTCPYCLEIVKYDAKVDVQNPELWRVSKLSKKELNELLGLALKTLKRDMDPFYGPVDPRMYPTYYQIVVHPMSLLKIEQKIVAQEYNNTAEFRSDMSWILHNCIVFNSIEHPLSSNAKKLIAGGKQETLEIESCPECYRSAVQQKESWFTDVCHPPHALVWAKLAGYPHWPAKVISLSNEVNNSASSSSTAVASQMRVRVHFFADHTKQKLPPSDVFFLSEQPPPDGCKNRSGFADALAELNKHIESVKGQFGCFHFYPTGLQFSLQPMLQLWMINPPPAEVISNARALSRETFSIQCSALLKKNDTNKRGEQASVEKSAARTTSEASDKPSSRSLSAATSSDASDDTSSPECPETKTEKRQKLKAALTVNRDDTLRRFAKPLFGIIPEKLPKFNLLDQLDREEVRTSAANKNNSATTSTQPSSSAEKTVSDKSSGGTTRGAGSETTMPVPPTVEAKQREFNFEQIFTKAVETFHKKQQLQLALSLRTAFAVFREEASHDLSDAHLTSFLKACDTLQVKCEENVMSSFQQAVTGCITKCASAAQEAALSIPSSSSSSSSSKTGNDSADDANARIVELERAEFVSTLVQSMITDTERQVSEAKSKHWCTNCKNEANLHCCRYASYCSYDCQTKHWPQHRQICCQVASQPRLSHPAQSQ